MEHPVLVTDAHVAAVRTLFREHTADRLAGLEQSGLAEGGSALMGGVLTELAHWRFGAGRSGPDVVFWVARMRTAHGDLLTDLDPLAAEQIIRTALGEESTTHAFEESTEIVTQFLVSAALLIEADLDDAGLEKLLERARARAERFCID